MADASPLVRCGYLAFSRMRMTAAAGAVWLKWEVEGVLHGKVQTCPSTDIALPDNFCTVRVIRIMRA